MFQGARLGPDGHQTRAITPLFFGIFLSFFHSMLSFQYLTSMHGKNLKVLCFKTAIWRTLTAMVFNALQIIGPSAARPFSYRANVAVVTRDVCKYRRTDRSLGAVAGRLAVSSVGALHAPPLVRLGAFRFPAWHALNDAIRREENLITCKSKCLCFVGFNTSRCGAELVNRRVALEAAFRSWQQAAPAWLGMFHLRVSLLLALCRRHLTGLASRLEQIRVASSKFRSALIPQMQFSIL